MQTILENKKQLKAEEIQAARKSRDTDDPLDTLIFNHLAMGLTRCFIKGGWSANAVTLSSLLAGISGGILFYPRNLWLNIAGMLLVILALVLDCSDGQVARLTHTSSQFGRVLDGMVDTVNFLTIYVALGLRMMGEAIPFTQRPWSFYIWLLVGLTMLCHSSQSRMADYYRGLHLYFLKGSDRATLSRWKTLQAEVAALPQDAPWFEKIYLRLYSRYTQMQEKRTPMAQRLLNLIEEHPACLPWAAEAYVAKSRPCFRLVFMLNVNIRMMVLFALLLAGLHLCYLPFVFVILEAVQWVLVARYEKLAAQLGDAITAGDWRSVSAADAPKEELGEKAL